MAAKYIVRERTARTYRNPYKQGGNGVGYTSWRTIAKKETFKEAAEMAEQRPNALTFRGVFYRGQRCCPECGHATHDGWCAECRKSTCYTGRG